MLESQNQLPNGVERAKTSVVLIVFLCYPLWSTRWYC